MEGGGTPVSPVLNDGRVGRDARWFAVTLCRAAYSPGFASKEFFELDIGERSELFGEIELEVATAARRARFCCEGFESGPGLTGKVFVRTKDRRWSGSPDPPEEVT